MQLPSPSEPDSVQVDPEFERSLEDVERSLEAIKERYTQVQHDRRRQARLQQRFDQVKQELRKTQMPQLRIELKQVKQTARSCRN